MNQYAVYAAVVVVAFAAGVVFSQKIKDWLAGVPAGLRTELNAVETAVIGKVKAAQSAAVADLKAKVVPPTPPLVTATVTGPSGATGAA